MPAQLLLDCNYILYKNIFTLHKMNRLYGDFHTAMNNNIAKYVSMNKWENVFLVSDSNKKSWRKKYLDTYKGTRKKAEDIDFVWVFEQYDIWKDEMKKKYNVVQGDHIEGDDWIAAIVHKSNKSGISNVIITSDEDMPQLLGYKINDDKSWINMQIIDTTGKEKIYLPIGWQLWITEYDDNRSSDPFNLDGGHEWLTFFNKITTQWHYEEINPMHRLFVKIIQGDKSDNINSIYERLTKTGKMMGIGKAGAETFWNFYKDNYKDYFSTKDPSFVPDIINCIERIYGVSLDDERVEIITTCIKCNIKLIELHYRHFPDWVVEQIIDELNEKI